MTCHILINDLSLKAILTSLKSQMLELFLICLDVLACHDMSYCICHICHDKFLTIHSSKLALVRFLLSAGLSPELDINSFNNILVSVLTPKIPKNKIVLRIKMSVILPKQCYTSCSLRGSDVWPVYTFYFSSDIFLSVSVILSVN